MMFRALCFVFPLLAAHTLYAAGATDVPDAADGDDPIDALLSVRFDYTWQKALITRENTQPIGDVARTVDARELDYQRNSFRLRPRVEVGLFHDLSTFFEWPIVLHDEQSTRYAEGTNAQNSSIARDMASAPTIQGWGQTQGSGGDFASEDGTAYGFPASAYNAWKMNPEDGVFQSIRAGFDYPTLGLRWSPTNNERDASKPTITLQADYNLGFIPLPIWNPTEDAHSVDDPGAVAQGLHLFHFHVGMSKRWRLLDPYFLVDYWLPFASSDTYLAASGFQPRHRGGFTLGLEIVALEREDLSQKLAVDLRSWMQYHSEGRDYSEMSDALGELTKTGQFMRVGGQLGIRYQALEYLIFELQGAAIYDTEHFITAEAIGSDKNNNEVVDIALDKNERNPYFNPVSDTPGRRFKVDENVRLQGMAQLTLAF